MSEKEQTESSGSEPELSASSSNFDPLKALYAEKIKLPVENAPMYENIQQYEAAQKSSSNILPVGMGKLVKKREEEKKIKKKKEEEELEEKNKQRFAKFGELSELVAQKKVKKKHNVVTRMLSMQGPLGALKTCVDQRLRIKVVTRHAAGIRGELHATCVAFDKQWNLALTDVLEIWKRKGPRKRKVPPGMGAPIEKGTAATISAVPVVTETPLGKGIWECTRHIPQMMVRGEHVVLVNIVER